jgi:hypothetical protein
MRRSLQVSVEQVEITRGRDGLLRGKPEPVLLLAAYRLAAVASFCWRSHWKRTRVTA